MNITKFFKLYKFQLSVVVLLTIPLLFLIRDNLAKVIVLESFTIIWFVLSFKTKRFVLPSLLYILITLPFNLTYQLPLHVLFFNTDPFVNGMYTNYLVPTLSVLDIGLVLLTFSYIYEYGLKHTKVILQKYKLYFVLFAIFLVLQNLLKLNLVSIIGSVRLLLAILTLLFSIDYFKIQQHKEILKYVALVTFINVLIQGIIGILQFKGGASLGLSFLGESQIISGMQGSSFVTLNGAVFLRAYGAFPHPNILAGYLIMSILLCIYLLKNSKGSYKVLAIITAALSGVFVLFTFSRIAILLAILIFVVTLLSLLSKKKLYSFAPILLITRFLNLFSGGDTSWKDRVNLMKSSFLVIKNNLILGTGLGNFTKGMEGYVPKTTNEIFLVQPVHNVLLLMFAELGILGTLLYLLFMGKILLSNTSKMDWFKWLIVITLVVIGCFDHYLWSLPQGMIIGGVLFMLVIL